jgi:putative lipoic acid-binding regulatory protein
LSDGSRSSNEDPRARALALLEATHEFPVEYAVSIITVSEETVVAEVRAAVEFGLPEPLPEHAYETVLSGAGRYASHRFKVPVASAEEVLALYDRLRVIAGVKSIL